MKKTTLFLLLIPLAFVSGFAFKSVLAEQAKETKQPRATGIGGIFFKCKDPKALRAWYHTHLGLHTNQYGAVFEWRQGADTTKKGFTQWSPFKETTRYFEPSKKDFMINYRVEHLDALIADLKKNGVTVVDSIATYDYGKFVHILDLEGNNLELWEPNDVVYENMGKQSGSQTTK